jgi:hypothetical protein
MERAPAAAEDAVDAAPVDDRDPGEPGDPPGRRRLSVAAGVQIAIAVAVIAGWAAIYVWTVTGDRSDPPDRLPDPTFAAAAEPICAATLSEIEALGLPTEVASPAERAALVTEENDLLLAMLDDLQALPSPSGDAAVWIEQWLEDWHLHVQDRQDWADDLEAGDDHLFVESARAGEQVSKVVDNFAEVNDMPSCATPGDV